MLADDLRRLAEEISGAYEERMRGISELKKDTAEKLADYRLTWRLPTRSGPRRLRPNSRKCVTT